MTDRPRQRLSRRGFLQTASGTIAAASAASFPFEPAAAQVPNIQLPALPGEQVGWAIVGLGRLAINQSCRRSPKCSRRRSWRRFVSGRPGEGEAAGAVYGSTAKNIYTYDTFDQIADEPGRSTSSTSCCPTACTRSTRSAPSRRASTCCARSRWRTRRAECEQMIAAAKAANRKLMIGYRLHYEPYNQALDRARARDGRTLGPTR